MRLKYHFVYFTNKLLGKDYPCGRTKKDYYLCCRRPMTEKTSYFSEDRRRVYCKYCNHEKMSSSHPIKSLDTWSWE